MDERGPGSGNAQFFEVLECDSHSNFATAELKSPGEGPTPDNVVLAFTDCVVHEGADFSEIWTNLDAWAAYMTEHGYGEGTWIMFPAFGGGGAEFDFKILSGYESHTELGQDFELYVKRADYLKRGELFDSLFDCDDARVYDGTVRRVQVEED